MPDPFTIAKGAGAVASIISSSGAAKQAAASQAAAGQAAAAGTSAALATKQFFQDRLKQEDHLNARINRNRIRQLEALTPERIEAASLQRLRKSKQQIEQRITASASARGLSPKSGLTLSQLYETDRQFAAQEAQVDFDSRVKAIGILGEGLKPGLQRTAQLTQAVSGASNAVVSAYGTQAQTQLNIAGQQSNRATSLGQGAGALLGSLDKDSGGLSDFIGSLGGN